MKHKVDKDRRMDDTKLPWHADRVISFFQNGERVAPIHIDMGIAKFCNVKCVFCYGMFQQMAPELIEREPLMRAMDEFGQIGVKSIAIIGDGEPTCNPHFYEALRRGKASGLDLATSTNGVLLEKDEQRQAVLETCEWMRFCLSAGTPEGYEAIHGKPYFERVKKNVEALVRQRDKSGLECDIGLQAVFVPTLMADEMVEEAKLAVKLGVDYFVIKQCSLPDPEGKSGMMDFDVTAYDDPRVIEALQKAEALSTDRTKIIPKWNIMAQKGKKPYEGCRSIPLISEVSGNGDWYPCGYMFGANSKFKKDFRFGNLREQGPREIWESERYWAIVKKMANYDVQHDCKGSCRQDKTNEYCYRFETDFNGLVQEYKGVEKPTKGINFI